VGYMGRPYISIGLSKAEFETVCDCLNISLFGKKSKNPLYQILSPKFRYKLEQRMKENSKVIKMPSPRNRFKKALQEGQNEQKNNLA